MIPDGYMDGCTWCPDRLGRVSHRHVCDEHDRACWTERHLIDAVGYHFKWAEGIVRAHARNWPWQPVAFALALAGLIALLTVGWIWWRGRPRWDA